PLKTNLPDPRLSRARFPASKPSPERRLRPSFRSRKPLLLRRCPGWRRQPPVLPVDRAPAKHRQIQLSRSVVATRGWRERPAVLLDPKMFPLLHLLGFLLPL